jgi:hypothetical protein
MIAMTVTLVGCVYVSFSSRARRSTRSTIEGRDKIIAEVRGARARRRARAQEWLNDIRGPRPAPCCS